MSRLFESSILFKDIRAAIYDDGYQFSCVHGPPRSSKSTIALWAAYSVYEDWDKVLNCTIFNLPSLIQRMEDGLPERWPTSNGLHMRVPIIVWDDFGVHGNKADTQHSTAWDIFKGGFDALGTAIGVLMATMVDAGEATQQLQGKYTHEITVSNKGKYKYDRVYWKQDFNGFHTIMKKEWIENGEFEPLPLEFYKKYDASRCDLAKQVFVRLKDSLSLDTVDMLLKILKPSDIQLLRLIETKGPLKYELIKTALGEAYDNTMTKCRARSLVIATNMGSNHYKLDLSSIGVSVLEALDEGKGSAELRHAKAADAQNKPEQQAPKQPSEFKDVADAFFEAPKEEAATC